eukprot:ctg_1371.g455
MTDPSPGRSRTSCGGVAASTWTTATFGPSGALRHAGGDADAAAAARPQTGAAMLQVLGRLLGGGAGAFSTHAPGGDRSGYGQAVARVRRRGADAVLALAAASADGTETRRADADGGAVEHRAVGAVCAGDDHGRSAGVAGRGQPAGPRDVRAPLQRGVSPAAAPTPVQRATLVRRDAESLRKVVWQAGRSAGAVRGLGYAESPSAGQPADQGRGHARVV